MAAGKPQTSSTGKIISNAGSSASSIDASTPNKDTSNHTRAEQEQATHETSQRGKAAATVPRDGQETTSQGTQRPCRCSTRATPPAAAHAKRRTPNAWNKVSVPLVAKARFYKKEHK